MGDPVHERDAAADAVRLAASAALEYLDSLDSAPLRHPNAVAASESLGAGPLPENGDGTLAALRELTGPGMQAAIQSAGPRMFHFVTGGVTPAALGADWLATLVDQNALSWVSSPLASRLEAVSVDWLKELFRLPAALGGRDHHRGDDGELRGPGLRAAVVGGASRRRPGRARLRRPSGGPGPLAAATCTPASARRSACSGSGATAFGPSAATAPAASTSTPSRGR